MGKYDWLNKKTPRSVDQLRPWPENPRLNPEESHITLSDYVEDFIQEQPEKESFFDLIKSIAEDGFIPADPMVVWQNVDNGKYYVAEGNRRLIALKLLRDPDKAPRSIRTFIKAQASKVNKRTIAKILVSVAPTFESAEWYINQRNSLSSLQRRWSRVQQQRWIAELYDKYKGNIDKITSITKLSQGGLEDYIRVLKIKDLIKEPEVKSKLNSDEFERANSHRFPITILERFFDSKDVITRWGIEYDGADVKITSNKSSFFNAYAELIKRIINKDIDKDKKIDTRTVTSHLEDILNSLPQVEFRQDDEASFHDEKTDIKEETSQSDSDNNKDEDEGESWAEYYARFKGNPNRNKLVLEIYTLQTDSYRLNGLFNEFKYIPFKYESHIASSLRVFLDLAVLKYIETEELETEIKTHYKADLRDIQLKRRLEYLKVNKLSGKAKTVVSRLLEESNEFSLDVLNGYIHGQDTHYLNKQFLNKFWDFLFPLFQILLVIKEENV